LRKRVSSYFQSLPNSPRTQAMVQLVRDIDISITPSEAEALILENHQIKQLKPRYNVLLKDSKTYPYILLSDEAFPKLSIYRGKRAKRGHYFGPFPNAGAAHTTIHTLQKSFQIRDCENSVFNNRSRPCMQHQIGRCSAPCCDFVSKDSYKQQVENVRVFLKGKDQNLLQQWQTEMQEASDDMDFEQAAMVRDKIKALRLILSNNDESDLPNDADVLVILRQSHGVSICIGVRRSGRDLGTHMVHVKQALDAEDDEILQALLIERYQHETPPAEILLEYSETHPNSLQQLIHLLSPKKKIILKTPKRGARLQWLKQVSHSGEQNIAAHSNIDQQAAFEALGELFKLEETPQIIAAVDNAHLGGQQTVAAITYASWSGPEKDYYRRYKLDDSADGHNVTDGDDYAAMQAVLTRFFRAINEESIPCPDVMLIDGGKGQLSIAIETAQDAGLGHLKMIAVAKGKTRKLGEELLWPSWDFGLKPSNQPTPLKPGKHSPAMLLIARVRDEAHRFAGSYMRKRKKQSMFTSVLDDIEGIGKCKRSNLLKHFGGIDGIKKASREQLTEAPGISIKLAEKIFTKLHQ
ncbi:MAG: excinuclease ABC subunit UvrC, partial [Mariprofundaceae bacterium]